MAINKEHSVYKILRCFENVHIDLVHCLEDHFNRNPKGKHAINLKTSICRIRVALLDGIAN